MGYVLMNDEVVERDQAKVDIEDRGYQFGDGIYEVIRVYQGKFFAMDEHMERLYESAKKVKIVIPFEEHELKEKLTALSQKNKLQDGIIYLQVSRGVSIRQHHFPSSESSATLVAYTSDKARPLELLKTGVSAKLIADVRWLRCDIKSLNLLGNILAKQEAHDTGAFEAILHREGTVTEGSSSNVFIVKGNTIYSHPTTNLILNGITRRYIVDICEKHNLELKEQTYTVDDLLNADEVFIASTTAEIMPVVKVDAIVIGEGVPGMVTKALQEHFAVLIHDCIS
jgi:D-alanine transaminase